MFILSFKTGHDPAACLLEDGKIVAAAEEERFIRVKHATDHFPEHAIRFCLETRGLEVDDVDYIVFSREKNLRTFLKVAGYFLIRMPRNLTEFRYALSLLLVQLRGVAAALIGRAPYQQIYRVIGERKIYPHTNRALRFAQNFFGARYGVGVYSFDHHQCHAASAYYGSGFDDAAVLCMDGKGEATSISMWEGRGGTLSCLKRYGIFHSLGYLYGSITEFLGFRMNDGEYKVMGLAPYGKPAYDLDNIFSVSDRGVFVNTRYSLFPFSKKNLARRFPNLPTEYNEASPPQPNTDIASTLQDRLEKAALYYIKKLFSLLQPTTYNLQPKNLCLAGGVALNVKMNKAIWESGIVEHMWVQPAAGDMGNVLGAAWMLYHEKTGKRPEPLTHLYLGKEYTNEEIEEALKNTDLRWYKTDDVSRDAANMLAEGSIVAWFQGRFEFGPRALGARSVLADPRDVKMKDIINAKVKFREPFRPFCPSFLEGHGEEIMEHYMSSPFMVMSFALKPGWSKKIPAVAHVDNTVRPQEVSTKTHPRYGALIKHFYEKTGVPVVLNTSLNVRGEPIVNTPAEAIAFFKKTDVDYLAIGNYLVSK